MTSLSERFYIEIVDWEPKSVAKLDTSTALCLVVLPELGNLAGFFRFCPWMADSFVVAVSSNLILLIKQMYLDRWFLIARASLIYLNN